MAFLVDDILLFPVKGTIWVGKKFHELAMEEILDEEGTRQELRELYMRLEMEQISEEEFEEREA
ncbi:MAG: gas vesicle protein GvpG, partial [Candidatus Hydrothermarchaeaceae archaeon]